jgi:hypothetical protein
MSIVERISPVFEKNYPLESRDGIWNFCMSLAVQCELTEANLENMCGNALTSGFVGDGGGKEIVWLAEALGIYAIGNPETGVPPEYTTGKMSIDELLDEIQVRLPFQINFPPFHGNCTQGLKTKFGVTSNRHVWYLWVLKRIMELCPDPSSSIIEVGAGFGVLGYYLDRAGYRDYTTIDLALINACQTYFLAKNLPDRNIIISGDVENPFDPQHKDSFKLLHSTDFKGAPRNRFNIMVNMDGLTEYGIAEVSKYVQSDCAPMLLSINHEVNPYRVCELKQNRKLKYRYPFWLRNGYVEELYVS